MPNPHIRAQMRLTSHELLRLTSNKSDAIKDLQTRLKLHKGRIRNKTGLVQSTRSNGGTCRYIARLSESTRSTASGKTKSKTFTSLEAAENAAIEYNQEQIDKLLHQIEKLRGRG